MNAKIFDLLKCAPQEELYGFYLSNGHWSRPTSNSSEYRVRMSYWLDMYCQNQYAEIWPIEQDLEIEFVFNQIQGIITDLKSVNLRIK